MKTETIAEIYCFLEQMKYPIDVNTVKNALCNTGKVDTMWAMIEKTGGSKSIFYKTFVDFFVDQYLLIAPSHPKIFQKLLDRLPINQATADLVFDLLVSKQITLYDSDFQKYFPFISERQIRDHFIIGDSLFELILAALRSNCNRVIEISPSSLIDTIFGPSKDMKDVLQKLSHYYHLLDYKPFFQNNWDNQQFVLRIINEFQKLTNTRLVELCSMEYNYGFHFYFDIIEKVGRDQAFERMISVYLPANLYKSWCGILPHVMNAILLHTPNYLPECCKNPQGEQLWGVFKTIPTTPARGLPNALTEPLLISYPELSPALRTLFGWLLFVAGDSDTYQIVQSYIQDHNLKPTGMVPLLPAITKNGRNADWLIPYFEKIKNVLDVFDQFNDFYPFAASVYQVDCTQINIWIHFLCFLLSPRFETKFIPGLLFLNSLDESTRKHAVNWIMETQSLEDRKKYLNVYDMLVVSGYKDWFSKKAIAGMKEVFDAWLSEEITFHHWYILARFLAILPAGTYKLKDLKQGLRRYDSTTEGFKFTQIITHLLGSAKHDSEDIDSDNKTLWNLIDLASTSNSFLVSILDFAAERFFIEDIQKFFQSDTHINAIEDHADKAIKWISVICSMFLKFSTAEILKLTPLVVQQVSGRRTNAYREIWFEVIRKVERDRGIRWIAHSDAFTK